MMIGYFIGLVVGFCCGAGLMAGTQRKQLPWLLRRIARKQIVILDDCQVVEEAADIIEELDGE